MKETVYNKLIRDKIPEIIENDGKEPITKTITDENEFLQLLIEKLLEEVNEFKVDPSVVVYRDIHRQDGARPDHHARPQLHPAGHLDVGMDEPRELDAEG